MNKMEALLIDFAEDMMTRGAGYASRLGEDAHAVIARLSQYPHAFVLACLMDRRMDASAAWSIPRKVSEATGGWEFERWSALTAEEYIRLFQILRLHRFPRPMALVFSGALERIRHVYGGDASRIWAGETSAALVMERFREFKGCGPKIAAMAASVLVLDCGVKLCDLSALDIAADVHVVRVFQRMGLIEADANPLRRIAAVIGKARGISPDYPGRLDLPVWDIGRTYCKAHVPQCGVCPANGICPKRF